MSDSSCLWFSCSGQSGQPVKTNCARRSLARLCPMQMLELVLSLLARLLRDLGALNLALNLAWRARPFPLFIDRSHRQGSCGAVQQTHLQAGLTEPVCRTLKQKGFGFPGQRTMGKVGRGVVLRAAGFQHGAPFVLPLRRFGALQPNAAIAVPDLRMMSPNAVPPSPGGRFCVPPRMRPPSLRTQALR